MKRILVSAGTLIFIGAVAISATGAFFSDTETSTGNTFAAGSLDLLVDSEAHYAGLVCDDGQWSGDEQETTRPELIGQPCSGTWALTDLGPGFTFFNLGDLKPGDEGENTISLHVENNDAYVCAVVNNLVDDDNGLTEPEEDDGDTTGGPTEGELSGEVEFFAWRDNGEGGGEEDDNIWNGDEPALFEPGPASNVLGGVSYPLFTPGGEGAMPGGTTEYIGLAWCYGEMTVNPVGNVITCDGELVTNVTQTDSMTADLHFYAEQARNNSGFTCPAPDEIDPDAEVLVGAVLGDYVAPSCDVTVSGGASIQTALDGAAVNSTVCVDETYTGAGDSAASRIETAGVTLAATTQGVDLFFPVVLSADGVTVTGFDGEIGQAESPAEVAAFYLDNDATNATISYNNVVGVGAGAGVLTETGASLGGGLISNNVFDGALQGMYLNPHTGTITIRENDFIDNVVGIAGLNGAVVRFNEFDHTAAAAEGIGIDETINDNTATVNFNNFLNGQMINTYDTGLAGVISVTTNAENNFFNLGGATQVDETNGDVDFTPEAGAAYAHN